MPLSQEQDLSNGKANNNDHSRLEKAVTICAPSSIAQEAPDGGLVAWLQVASAFCLFLNTWGVANMFGVFQTFYETELLSEKSASAISWIGSIQGALLFFGGIISGPIFDMGYLRTLVFVGTLLIVSGMMITSISKAYWQVVLAQGVTVGLGFGCLFLLCVSTVSQYFTSKKAFAFGIASTGGSIGGVLYPVIFRQLQPRIGFGWATRVIALVMLGTMSVPMTCMRSRTVAAPRRRKIIDLKVFSNKPYLVFIAGTFFGFMGLYVTFFYIELYAKEKTNMANDLSTYCLSIINASSIVGRLVPNFYADKFGPLNVQIIFAFATAILCFGWIGIQDTISLTSFCILYGLSSGSFGSLPGVTVVSLSKDLSTIGVQISMAFMVTGCGLLIGEPIAGAILQGSGGWVGLQTWCGTLLAVSGFFSLAARVLKVGTNWDAKA